MWMASGRRTEEKAGGGGCQELAATTPGFSALSLSLLCTRLGVSALDLVRLEAGGRAEHQDEIAPSSPPAHPEPTPPPHPSRRCPVIPVFPVPARG